LTRIENEMQEYKTPKTKTNTIWAFSENIILFFYYLNLFSIITPPLTPSWRGYS
jgi:hypothetical protein